MPVSFTKHGDVYVARTTLVLGQRSYDLVVRVDARPHSGIRVDAAKPLTPMWEAIDGGEGFRTVTEAKLFARRWLHAARKQETFSPKVTK